MIPSRFLSILSVASLQTISSYPIKMLHEIVERIPSHDWVRMLLTIEKWLITKHFPFETLCATIWASIAGLGLYQNTSL